jgi:hypothetical protein
MIENNKLLFGLGFLVLSIIYIYILFQRRSLKKADEWDLAMLFKGLVGGLAFLALGAVLLLMHFGYL